MGKIGALFHSFTSADWIEVLLLVVSIVAIYHGVIGRLERIETSDKFIKEKIEIMEKEGTQAGQLEFLKETGKTQTNFATLQLRMQSLENQNATIVPKINEINNNTEDILKELQRR